MRTRIRAVTALVGAVLLAITACNPAVSNSDSDDTITLGISPFQDTMLPLIGVKKGWFADKGVKVKLKRLAWNSIMPAVASGSVDVAVNNTTGVVSVAAKSTDIRYVYGFNPFTEGSALIGGKGSGLKTLEQLKKSGLSHEEARKRSITQLKGKRIVTTQSTDMGKAIYLALKSVGMTTKDVNIVDMDPDQGLAAFLSGTGDAYLGGVPQRARAVDEGRPVLLSGPDLAPPPINGFVTKKQYADEKQDELLKLIDVMHRIIRYCDAQTAACGKTIVQALNKETGGDLTVPDFVDAWQKIELYAPHANASKKMILDKGGVAYWKRTWAGDNDYLVKTDAIPEPADAKTFFTMQRTWDAYVEKYGRQPKND